MCTTRGGANAGLRGSSPLYAPRASTWERPANDLFRSRLMSLGEMMPVSRTLSMTRVRPSLHPSVAPSRLATGSAGLAVDTLSSGQATSFIGGRSAPAQLSALPAARRSPTVAPVQSP
jgi:hypothetical protein